MLPLASAFRCLETCRNPLVLLRCPASRLPRIWGRDFYLHIFLSMHGEGGVDWVGGNRVTLISYDDWWKKRGFELSIGTMRKAPIKSTRYKGKAMFVYILHPYTRKTMYFQAPCFRYTHLHARARVAMEVETAFLKNRGLSCGSSS